MMTHETRRMNYLAIISGVLSYCTPNYHAFEHKRNHAAVKL